MLNMDGGAWLWAFCQDREKSIHAKMSVTCDKAYSSPALPQRQKTPGFYSFVCVSSQGQNHASATESPSSRARRGFRCHVAQILQTGGQLGPHEGPNFVWPVQCFCL